MTVSANQIRASLRAEAHQHAREHLLDYAQLMHTEFEPAEQFGLFPHTRVLVRAFEKVALGETKRLLVCVPPRHGKSLIGSIALPTWLIGRDPALRIINATYGDDLTKDFAGKRRNAMQSQLYRDLFPETRLASEAQHKLATSKGGYIYATSIGGALTGKGADLVIVDDPLKAKDAVHSQAARDEAFNWITGTVMSRFDKPAEGRLIVIAQRLHTDDLVARLRDEGGWTMLVMPAEAQKPMKLGLDDGGSWELEAGDFLFPERFNESALAQVKADLGEANFAAQYLQDPMALGGTIFKVKHFQLHEFRRFDPAKMERIFQSWDTAVSEAEHAAYSVCTTWGVKGKIFALMDVFRQKLTYPDLLKAVHEQYQKHKPAAVLIERASSGAGLLQQLRNDGHKWAYDVRPVGSKVERAMQQVPKIEQGRVHVPRHAPWFETFINEVATFPLGRADQVDSMCQFLRAFDIGRDHVLFYDLKYWQERLGT